MYGGQLPRVWAVFRSQHNPAVRHRDVLRRRQAGEKERNPQNKIETDNKSVAKISLLPL